MMEQAGLKISDIKYGSWSIDNTVFGDQKALFQDVVLIRKP